MKSINNSSNEKLLKLSKILSKSSNVIKLNSSEDKEEWTLANALIDIEESSNKFINVLLPKLLDDKLTEIEVNDLLTEVGEEFRHILYHIKDSKYYAYLV